MAETTTYPVIAADDERYVTLSAIHSRVLDLAGELDALEDLLAKTLDDIAFPLRDDQDTEAFMALVDARARELLKEGGRDAS